MTWSDITIVAGGVVLAAIGGLIAAVVVSRWLNRQNWFRIL